MIPTSIQLPVDDERLLAIHTAEELSEFVRAEQARLEDCVRSGCPGLEYATRHSDVLDGVIRRMFAIACAKVGRNVAPETIPLSVVATGGYGRRELCPHSDIDLTFIPHRDGDPLLDRIVKEVFTLVMRVFIDANHMEVGYAYRLMDDCGNLDHQTTSGLLDARLIAGSPRQFIQFEHEFWTHFNPADFIFAKLEERRAARQKFGVETRLVEPHIKEGAGGLRDLQTAVWMVQARKGLTAARVRGDRVREVLARHGWVTETEVDNLLQAKEYLFRVRNALHVVSGAERDQLVVTRQEEVAELLGYKSSDPDDPAATPAVEQFMRDFYRCTTTIDRLSLDIMRRTENSRLVIGIGLDCKRRQIVPATGALVHDDPVWMLWACELAQKYGLDFSNDLERSIVDLLATNPAVHDDAQAAEVLTRILGSPRGAFRILQRMADIGILGWFIPEFGAVLDLIPYDPSHDHTIGQHSLHVVRCLDELRSPTVSEDLRDFRMLISELPNVEQLYLAALLHDVGKMVVGRPHAESGAEIAEKVAQRLGWSESAVANVKFLVREHLVMAETSRLRDLTLDETIREFTTTVDDLDRLHMLYLLTYADTYAVGAGVWTQVKAKFLRDLYHRAERILAGEDRDEHDDAQLTRTRRRLMRELSVENLPPDELAAHIESMPAPYILNTELREIALHVGYVRKAREGAPVVVFHDERDQTFTEVTICSLDDPQPGLLCKIAGVLFAADLGVHSAQVYTRVSGTERIALDTLCVDFRGRQLTPGKRKEVMQSLTAVLTSATAVGDLLTRKKKPAEIGGPVETLTLRDDLSEVYTVVELASNDARGVLYRATGALSRLRWDIHSAKVSMFHGRFVCCFYVVGARDMGETRAYAALNQLMPTIPPSVPRPTSVLSPNSVEHSSAKP